MCNERNSSNHRICYTTWTYEVHAFKNKNKRKSLRYIFVYHFIFYMFFRICNFRITETRLRHSLWWERDELINHSKYIIGSGRKQPPLFYNKSFFKIFAIFTEKYPCWSVFVIKNFKATLIKRDSNTVVFFWILRNI